MPPKEGGVQRGVFFGVEGRAREVQPWSQKSGSNTLNSVIFAAHH